MGYMLAVNGSRARYSRNERRLFEFLPKDGTRISTITLGQRLARKPDGPFYARQVALSAVKSLMRKIDKNKEPFRLRATRARGPVPLEFWLEPRS